MEDMRVSDEEKEKKEQERKEKRREYARQYYLKNIEKYRVRNKEYNEKHGDKKSAYYHKNKDRYRESQKQFCEKNEGYKLNHAKTVRGRYLQGRAGAKRRGIAWNITLEEYEPFLKHPCQYCGGPLNETGVGLDRKNDEPFYSVSNVAPCCRRCNSTFIAGFSYEEKLMIAPVLREIDAKRRSREQS
jgi:hypothetical protein